MKVPPRRSSITPTSAGWSAEPGIPAVPYLVGRTDPGNVVLLDPELREGTGHAVLRVPADHPSMFDHPQDHLPGMVLAEAARQLALFTAHDSRGISTAKSVLVDLNVTFAKFGELEPATVLVATPGQEQSADGADGGNAYYTQGGPLELAEAGPGSAVTQLPMTVEVRQHDESIARFALTLARIRG